MEAVFIFKDKKIRLYNYSETVIVEIICPSANIQNMLTTLGGDLISKKRICLPYRHNAGEVYSIELRVTLGKVVEYLKPEINFNCINADNYNEFREIAGWQVDIYQLKIDKLYLFGNCSKHTDFKSLAYTSYSNKFSRKILIPNKNSNDFGNKRYVCNAGVWYSNKKY